MAAQVHAYISLMRAASSRTGHDMPNCGLPLVVCPSSLGRSAPGDSPSPSHSAGRQLQSWLLLVLARRGSLDAPNIMWAGTASPGRVKVDDADSSLRLPGCGWDPPSPWAALHIRPQQQEASARWVGGQQGKQERSNTEIGPHGGLAMPCQRTMTGGQAHPDDRAAMTFCSCAVIGMWLMSARCAAASTTLQHKRMPLLMPAKVAQQPTPTTLEMDAAAGASSVRSPPASQCSQWALLQPRGGHCIRRLGDRLVGCLPQTLLLLRRGRQHIECRIILLVGCRYWGRPGCRLLCGCIRLLWPLGCLARPSAALLAGLQVKQRDGAAAAL